MKLLVFAHVPPPHHGQSFMVKLTLDGLRADQAAGRPPSIECYHVDARLSDAIADIGHASGRKLLLLLNYIAQAWRIRIRDGVRAFYYVPAPGLRAAVYRDWLVLAATRWLFPVRIYHWQAAGLGEWLAKEARPWERWITRFLLGKPTLSMVLGDFVRADGIALRSKQIVVIPNAVEDPCPDFENSILPARRHRAGASDTFSFLYLSLCMREKGLFDALEALPKAQRLLDQAGVQKRLRLVVAGKFYRPEEQALFEQRIAQADLMGPGPDPSVRYAGFVDGDAKDRLFRDADGFVFPSYYPMEGHPVSLVEAMAYGLPVVASRWRALPELFPAEYPWLVEVQDPNPLAATMARVAQSTPGDSLRQHYLRHFTREAYVQRLKATLLAVSSPRSANRRESRTPEV